MKRIYICAVRLAIEAEDEADTEDGVSALLSEQAKKFASTSCLLDWQYDDYGSPQVQLVDDDYGFDSGVPQLDGRVIFG